MEKPDGVVVVSGTRESFFRKWLEFLKPFHHLTSREMDIAAALLKKRWELSPVIVDESILDSVVMSENTILEIRKECDITSAHFQVVLGKLRKAGFVVDGKLNSRFIPDLKQDCTGFKFMIYFKFTNS